MYGEKGGTKWGDRRGRGETILLFHLVASITLLGQMYGFDTPYYYIRLNPSIQ